MSTSQQGRKRLRISDQDALLKWCRSNGFSLNQKQGVSTLAFDINRRNATVAQSADADFCLDVTEKGFRVQDSQNDLVAQGKELREVLKQLSLYLAGRHSAAS